MMDRKTMTLARKVAKGIATKDEKRAFREAAGQMGWQGSRGHGVVNFIMQTRVHSWTNLAALFLEEAKGNKPETAQDETYTLAHSAAFQAVQSVADRVPTADETKVNPFPYPTRGLIPEVDAALDRRAAQTAHQFMYFYATRTATVPLTDRTSVDALIIEEVTEVTEGLCQSGASLECSLDDPSLGLLRTLPESMLPGQERTVMIQCLPCYEASAEAYVRKLHHA